MVGCSCVMSSRHDDGFVHLPMIACTHQCSQSELAAAKASVKATLGDKERKINELVEELGTTQAMLTATQNELSVVRWQGVNLESSFAFLMIHFTCLRPTDHFTRFTDFTHFSSRLTSGSLRSCASSRQTYSAASTHRPA